MQLHWHTEPLLLITILGFAWIYALFAFPLKNKIKGLSRNPNIWMQVSYFSGVAIIYLAVGSPLDQIAEDYLFFAHMIQHMLLVYVAPPLLLLGIPSAWGDTLFECRWVRVIFRPFIHPVFAGLFFSFVYTLWHIPMLYEAALHVKWIHILEHATMFITAVFMWWPLIGPSERWLPVSSYGVRILYCFLLMVAQLPVFAFLSFSSVAIYETYVWAPRIIEGLDPLNDQVLGGIIMKVINMGVSLGVISYCFYRWAVKDSLQEA